MNYVCRFLRRSLGGFGETRLVLNLRPGETVQVREEQEILRTLDQEDTYRITRQFTKD
jgi:hypothetical protein